jgi:hypothetical protein
MQSLEESHIGRSCLGTMVGVIWDKERHTFVDSKGNSVEGIDPSNGEPGTLIRYYHERDGQLIFGQVGVRVRGIDILSMTHYCLSPDFRSPPDANREVRYEHEVTFYRRR